MGSLTVVIALVLVGGDTRKGPSTEVVIGEFRKLESTVGTRLLGFAGHHALVAVAESQASELFAIDVLADRKLSLGVVEGRIDSAACADWEVKTCVVLAGSSGGQSNPFRLTNGKVARLDLKDLGEAWLNRPLSPTGHVAVRSPPGRPPAVTPEARKSALASLTRLPDGVRYELTEDSRAAVIIEKDVVLAAAITRLRE